MIPHGKASSLHTARLHRTVAKSSGGGRSYRYRGNGDPKLYRPTDIVPQTGIYEVIHDRQHRESHEVVMRADDLFPACDTCDRRVRFRLVRTAPYIFDDEDFEAER
jgi:hypothetical protein